MLFGHYKFQFVRGECRVTPSKIFLPCSDADRLIAESMPSEAKGYFLIVGTGVSILLSYAGFMAYNSGHWVLALFALSWSVGIGYKTIHPPKDYVPLCEINKDEVTRISVSKGDGMYPRPCITIHARKDGGERVAYLKFSVRYQGGDEEVAKALEVFSDQDWEVVNEE